MCALCFALVELIQFPIILNDEVVCEYFTEKIFFEAEKGAE
jgi:hypothetical protein